MNLVLLNRIAQQNPEPIELKEYLADPYDPSSMMNAPVLFRVPADGGWRALEGKIVFEHDTALVVKEKCFGCLYNINPNWILAYNWTVKTEKPQSKVLRSF